MSTHDTQNAHIGSLCLLDLEASFPLTQSTQVSKLEKYRLTRIPYLINLSILGLEIWSKCLCHNIDEVSMFLLHLETTIAFTKEALEEKWDKECIKSIMYKPSHNVPKPTTIELL
jgi:hypothetical protein